jgi:methanogenic corrinoid protein MtbC1
MMSTFPHAGTAVDELMRCLEVHDRDGALAVMRSLRADGLTGSQLITAVLAPAQRRVGRLWETDRWDVAQEHAASGIVDAALAEIELESDVVPVHGSVVVTCAEGEWHVLPARMLAEQLRQSGWSVTFLGGSTPASDLAHFLDLVEPVAVALSCSMPVLLAGAERSIAAVHGHGVPVIAGGAGFGGDGRRAQALGADGWADSSDAAAAILHEWCQGRPSLRPGPTLGPALVFESIRPELRRESARQVHAPSDALGALDQVLDAVGVSLLTGDLTVIDGVVAWLHAALGCRGLSFDQAAPSLEAMAAAAPGDPAAIGTHLGAAAMAVREACMGARPTPRSA